MTVIRPIKGQETHLYDCLEATCKQDYPRSKLSIHFCIADRNDPALQTVQRLIANNPGFDITLFVEDEDPNLSYESGNPDNLGPNPKIRNMSRAYREAKGDIIWIIDCNVWVSTSVAGLMVDLLCGLGEANKGRIYKFVHQLPLVVDVSQLPPSSAGSFLKTKASYFGGLLEELFLSTSHAKFYTAISTVAIAPCTVGKSNMFRRSHLDALTQSSTTDPKRGPGIDFFSDNICEDHLIGDLLWKAPVPPSAIPIAAEPLDPIPHLQPTWRHHALLPNPPCIQPVSRISLGTYAARRIRWLRVRKFTVPSATFVEPGTESLLGTAYGAFGLTTYPPVASFLHVPPTWLAFAILWILGMLAWARLDRWVWTLLQSWEGEYCTSVGSTEENEVERRENDLQTPVFVGSGKRRDGWQWFCAWLGRELLALPVWAWAVLGGTKVVWRGRRFKVGIDMRVREVGGVEGRKKIM